MSYSGKSFGALSKRFAIFIAIGSILVFGYNNCSGGYSSSGANSVGSLGIDTVPPAAPTPVPTPPPPGVAYAGDIVDGSGNIVATAYQDIAAKLSGDAGIAYRYGPDASAYGRTGNTGRPTWYERPSQKARRTGYWQGGGPESLDPGNYSSNQGNITFVADNVTTSTGVGALGLYSVVYNTYDQQPRVSWTRSDDGLSRFEDDNATYYKSKAMLAKQPVAIGRCNGQPGACPTGIVAFQSGLIGVYAGSNTAHNRATAQLAPGKVPTAVALTNAGEFALITVWDTINLKGQIAVVALAGLCEGCDPYSPGGWYDYWHEWKGVYPGLSNKGDFAFIKVLGYIDLPDMKAPTEIAVTTGMSFFSTLIFDSTGHIGNWATPLTIEANRQKFVGTGPYAGTYAKGGMAVVISKSENKVSFIDLKPLFTYVNSVYFGGTQDTFSTTVNNLGQADNQWPYTFNFMPAQTPTVVKTLSTTSKPTAVKTNLWGGAANHRAWVATQDGVLHIYSLGRYPVGQGGTAADLVEKGTVAVGQNPTSLSHGKYYTDSNIDATNQMVIVVSRGERKIQWVKFNNDMNSGSIVKTLLDTRIIDPIWADDGDNFFNQIPLVTISDYGGKKVSSFRHGSVIIGQGGTTSDGIPRPCQGPVGCGMGINGNDAFEFGGSFAVPGKPFQNVSANVP